MALHCSNGGLLRRAADWGFGARKPGAHSTGNLYADGGHCLEQTWLADSGRECEKMRRSGSEGRIPNDLLASRHSFALGLPAAGTELLEWAISQGRSQRGGDVLAITPS
jgi:hypothetical protein